MLTINHLKALYYFFLHLVHQKFNISGLLSSRLQYVKLCFDRLKCNVQHGPRELEGLIDWRDKARLGRQWRPANLHKFGSMSTIMYIFIRLLFYGGDFFMPLMDNWQGENTG